MKSTEEFLKTIEDSVKSYTEGLENQPVKRLLKTQVRLNPYWNHKHKIKGKIEDSTNEYTKYLVKNLRD